jgi:ketosteroid isomerase-like protein
MDALTALCTDDVVNVPFEGWPEDSIYHGRDGMKRLAGTWWDLFDGTHMKVERTIEDGERLVALITHTGTRDGVRMEQKVGGIFTFRDGLIAEARWFLGFEETLAAASLD